MTDERFYMDAAEFREFVRKKLDSLRSVTPGTGWEEYYRGRLSAYEEVEGAMRSLGLFDDK